MSSTIPGDQVMWWCTWATSSPLRGFTLKAAVFPGSLVRDEKVPRLLPASWGQAPLKREGFSPSIRWKCLTASSPQPATVRPGRKPVVPLRDAGNAVHTSRTQEHDGVQLPITFKISSLQENSIGKPTACSTLQKVLLGSSGVISTVQYVALCVHRSWYLMVAVLLWITVIIPDNNSGELWQHLSQASASSYFDLSSFSSCTQKKCNFAAWILYLKVWNEILTLNESHILWLQTHSLLLSSAPHTHSHRVSDAQVFMSNLCYWFGACNCKLRSRKWSKSQLLTGLGLTLS